MDTVLRLARHKQNLCIKGNDVWSYSTHVATIDHAKKELRVHGYWSSTTSRHIGYVAREYGLTKIDAPVYVMEPLPAIS